MRNSRTADECNVIELFELQAIQTPQYTAVSENDRWFTYTELNEKANQLAHCLKKYNVSSGVFVGILLDPGIDFIVSILAIVKLGAVYLPLDALAPQRRLNEILEDAKPQMVITHEENRHLVSEEENDVYLIKNLNIESITYPRENPGRSISSMSPLYMMYTSGSTGKPKGVIVPHRAVAHLVKQQNDFQIKARDRIAQFSNLAFDASPFEIWSALLNGATVNIVPLGIRTDPALFKSFLQENHIQYLCLPTGFFHQLIKSAADTLNEVRVIVFGGEQVNAMLLKKFLAYRKENKLPIELINGYGPTETTAYTCRQKINEHSVMSDDQLSSIGTPIDNVTLYILDEHKSNVLEGELYVSGVNLALAYHNCALQNQEKFIPNPFCQEAPYQRLYKTGDRVRQLPTGEYQFLGRFDDQVKIGGFRIHLNEIEEQLMHYPLISLAAVKVELGGGLHKMLTAYIVLSSKEDVVSADEIRSFLSDALPSYMLPAKYVKVDELPLTLVGKVDKSKLDSIPHTDLSFHIDSSSSSVIEEKVKKIWLYLLNRTAIDTNKNLFELGANSLLITEACEKINNELQSELQVADILSHPTIHKLSRYLEGDIDVPIVKVFREADTNDVAIVGMACRFPGANSVQEYWDNLCQGKESLRRFSEEDFSGSSDQDKLGDEHFVPVKGILTAVDQFDANFFGYNPGDAHIADPQQRIFLECVWEALEHAAIAPNKLEAKTISIFAGMSDSTYLQENLLKNSWFAKEHDLLQQRIACSTSMLSTQVSYRLNLKGRSLNVNTACSTGLITVEQACQDLILGQSDIALAGAASIIVPQVNGYWYQNGSIVSPDGHCRPFSDKANGTVFSNGVGLVILKRLADAIADRDTIYAVINGCGVNNDGSDKLGFAAPSTSGQMSCIREALGRAKIKADEVSYLEAHGTATALGDVVEIAALSSVYREQTEKKQFCFLGSVKANIGHTDVTAGIAGLIKTALCLHHQKIPPMLHFEQANPNLFLHESPFVINKELVDWPTNETNRYAGVSAFGVGGTNIHMVLSDHIQEPTMTAADKEQLMVLSAKTEKALAENTQNLLSYLTSQEEKGEAINLADVAYTLHTGREDFPWRCFGVGKTIAELSQRFAEKSLRFCDANIHQNLVFMFPGQGMQYPLMAIELMEKIPFFAALVEQGMSLAKNYLNCDLLAIIGNPRDERLKQTQYAQPALFIIEYALAHLLMSYGVKPDALIGHSIGEYVAACLAGVFSFEDAIILVCERGLLMANAEVGAMLAIECTEKDFTAYQCIVAVELALHNAPNHCVASGSVAEISQLEQHLFELGTKHQRLNVSHAFHSRFMESVEKPFKELLRNISLAAPILPMVSNVTGTWLSAEEAIDPDYWYRHLRHTVKMCEGFQTLVADEHSFFIEVGPGHSLSTFLKEIAHTQNKTTLMTQMLPHARQAKEGYHQLIKVLGDLWQAGVKIDWQSYYGPEKRRHIPLPTYAFQRQRYWVEPDEIPQRLSGSCAIYKPVWSHQTAYLEPLAIDLNTLSRHSWILFKDKTCVSEQLIRFLHELGIQPIIVELGTKYVEQTAHYFQINPGEKDHYSYVFKKIKNELREPIILHLYTCAHSQGTILSSHEIEQQLELGFYSILYLTQAYIEHVGEHVPLKCAVITSGTQHVLGTETMLPINASLIGPCRVITQEHSALAFRLMDLNLDELNFYNKPLLSHIIERCLHEKWDSQHPIITYRNGYCWDIAYKEIKSIEKRARFKDGGVYLLTGGLGGIALSFCEAITKKVTNPKFILCSRSSVIPELTWDNILQDLTHKDYEKVRRLKKLHDMGAILFFHQLDVTQLEPLLSIVHDYINRFGAINGVIHAAGVAGNGLVQLKTKQAAEQVLMPKIHGTYNLAKVLQGISVDFIALMSSIAVLTGERGQVDYCAANACLDAFASARLFPAKFVVSLNWNTWRDVGMAVETQRPDDVDYFDRGNDISPHEGQQLFLRAMETNNVNTVISNYEPEQYASMLQQTREGSKAAQIKITRQDLNIMAHYLSPQNQIEEQLALIWQDNLGIDVVGVNDDFFVLGGHSLRALNLIEKINKTFASKLSIQHVYQAPTIMKLSELIHSELGAQRLDIVIPLKMTKEKPPYVFFCHPASGLIYCFNQLTLVWEFPISIYGLQDPSISAGVMLYDSIDAMADSYLSAIKKIQPYGPYFLVGYSFGGTVLYEVAHLLRRQGESIGLLALIESWSVFDQKQFHEHRFKEAFSATHNGLSNDLVDLAWKRMQLLLAYRPAIMEQEMVLFKATELLDDYKSIEHPTNGWSKFNRGEIHCHTLDANHETVLNHDNGFIIAKKIQQWMSNFLERPERVNEHYEK
jgi:amino acid adenylation domain-containing protein